MPLTVHWGDLWVPASMMVLSVFLSLGARAWRRRRQAAARWRSRTHWEWLPFLFGLVVAIGELSRLLDLPDPGATISEVVSRALALTTVFLAFRAVFLLVLRGTRVLFRRRPTASRS
ncbi:hypothetical protein NCG97_15885 [Streptomyces lydicamycinicus]|uniref:Uncharacterized protein n=1 Tax=Streptomyces lydicamycinicus TaxID=1546107 RepID=A0A0P4QZ13_9ACTN|nr:hypothetical protein [Streptomyces lydicamycinicus]USA01812.1 hypothetical protein NCG97_15885 [Streptomyces lydicamycinicus]GAO05681.1 hypothetical protein TPA0598_01_00500 [Streptomyces lydicamycinicus]